MLIIHIEKKILSVISCNLLSGVNKLPCITLFYFPGSGKKGSRSSSKESRSKSPKDKKRDKSGSPKRSATPKKGDSGKKGSRGSMGTWNLSRPIYSLSEKSILTQSLLYHFETVPNSKKLQTRTEMWLLNNFKIQIALKTLWKKVKLLILSNFTSFHNVFLMLFSSMC